MVVIGAVLTAALGRVFGVVELYFLAAAMLVAVAAAFIVVALWPPRALVRRWVRPEVLTAGDVGRVDLVMRAGGAFASPGFELYEAVGDDRTARIGVRAMRRGTERSAGYRVPTHHRGVIEIGPLVAIRGDVLGLARSTSTIVGVDELLVAPRAIELSMPDLGNGILGQHLLTQSQRLGQGEFHSLREYVPGDEPRTIHWKASARADELRVRQHTTDGLRRCTIVLDQGFDPDDVTAAEAFELACIAAASFIHAADAEGLETRFATSAGADLRGPTVAVQTMHHLARVEASAVPPRQLERDPGEGLGLVIAVTPGPDTEMWRMLGDLRDPTLTVVGVFTERGGAPRSAFAVDAFDEQALVDGWRRLVGVKRGTHRRGAA